MGKTKLRYISSIFLFALIFVLQCCNKYDESIFLDKSEYIQFYTRLSNNEVPSLTKGSAGEFFYIVEEWDLECDAASKATPVTSLSGYAGLIGFGKRGDSWSSSPLANLTNAKFSFDGDELVSDTNIPWSSIKEYSTLSVYAFAPYSIVSEIDCSNNSASFSYTVKDNVSEQVDIIAAKAQTQIAQDINPPVPLNFNHALTAVRFKTDEADVKCVKISGVNNKGTYNIGTGWSGQSGTAEYTINFADLGKNESTLILIPQTLPDGATVTLEFTQESNKSPITASLAGKVWKPGKMITYTLNSNDESTEVYFDLAAGNVTINNSTYKGFIFKRDGENVKAETVTGKHNDKNIYYVYQSTAAFTDGKYNIEDNRGKVGYVNGEFTRPPYKGVVTPDGTPWADYITNNISVENVIEMWDDGVYVKGSDAICEKAELKGIAAVRDAGRTHTEHHIKITGTNAKYNLVVDNIYTTYQHYAQTGEHPEQLRDRNEGGITYMPTKNKGNTELNINLVGDNRLGYIHIENNSTDKLNIQGTGSLTAANADFRTPRDNNHWDSNYYGIGSKDNVKNQGYISNHRKSAIGNDTQGNGNVYGIEINGGVIFAGTTKIENCSAIGGGGNGEGNVTINGGTVTAVATTTGTAIGGGIGFTDYGGEGKVTITNGNVYAYNFANRWNIPGAAIGGGGTKGRDAKDGTINISGGNIYAYSALGTAIGGGSSLTMKAGNATVNISGGTIIAKSDKSACIGGGSACTGGSSSGTVYNGGNATITITGNPIIRTGSIGGGTTGHTKGSIGSAKITVAGGDIQAQFVMAAGAQVAPSFTMTDGTIRKSNTIAEDSDYYFLHKNGGAVYLEDGTFTMTKGTIKDCTADFGGAVYIKGSASTTFTMTGGDISNCVSENGGGAVYLDGGNVSISGSADINYNVARNGNGGGVCINNGNFSMEGGSINSNSAFSINDSQNSGNSSSFGKGGGVYVASEGSVKVDLIGGEIKGNTSALLGGGICVEMGNSNTSSAEITVGTKNNPSNQFPKVTGNHTLIKGGGLYVSGINSNMSIYSGTLKQNSTSGYVPNPDVVNEGGMVTLLSESATTSVRITFDSNGGKESSQVEHLIVSATNSVLPSPVFTRDGYNLAGWHTRKDYDNSKGKYYPIDNTTGNVTINVTSNTLLYAKWERQGI